MRLSIESPPEMAQNLEIMKKTKLSHFAHIVLTGAFAATVLTLGPVASAQDVIFGSAQNITGDANLINATTLPGSLYIDAVLPNGNYNSPIGNNGSGNASPTSLTVDGVAFNALTPNSSSFGNATFTFAASSGSFNSYGNNVPFSTSPPSSAAFAAVMNAGGLYMNSGATGAGTITISSSALTLGDTYDLQIFNYSGVGGGETTLFTSANSEALSDTGGQFTTGTFTATGANEIIDFTQNAPADAGFTPVIGAISLFDVTDVPEPSTASLLAGGFVCLSVIVLVRRRKLEH